MSHTQEPDKFVDEIRARQRNIVFPDTARNARSLDAFLWFGSPNPTRVQSMGAWLLGSLFICMDLPFIFLAAKARDDDDSASYWLLLLISLAFILLGIRIFRNGFPR
jgi:hypothetical protein